MIATNNSWGGSARRHATAIGMPPAQDTAVPRRPAAWATLATNAQWVLAARTLTVERLSELRILLSGLSPAMRCAFFEHLSDATQHYSGGPAVALSLAYCAETAGQSPRAGVRCSPGGTPG
jgi:hypothetical protein